MKNWSYILIAGGILAGSSVYTYVFSDTGENPDTALVATTEGVTRLDWNEARTSFSKPSEDELRKKLTKLQYKVTQNDATERPFKNEYWNNKKEGIYVDIVSGEPLFSSTDKYRSGTGWPSFTRPIKPRAMITKADRKLFYTRTELRSRLADSHLGHLFDDGPKPTGKRYCINSASLRFVPKEELANQGYGEFITLFDK